MARMRLKSSSRLVLALLASTAISTFALAATRPSGSTVRADRLANAAGSAGGERVLDVGSDVFAGDAITTNSNGLAQIRFVDDTRIVIGPNSRLVIDKFVFNSDNTARQVTVDAVKGVFRFISGNSRHEAYSIRTPTMEIGVRGTVLDINARGPDSSFIFLQGSGGACDAAASCIDVENPCELWVAPRGGGFGQSSGIDRTLRVSAFYPFMKDQSRLDPAFRTNVGNCLNANSVSVPGQAYEDGNHTEQAPPPPPYGGGAP